MKGLLVSVYAEMGAEIAANACYTSPFPRWPWCTIAQHATGIEPEIVLICPVHRRTMLELRRN